MDTACGSGATPWTTPVLPGIIARDNGPWNDLEVSREARAICGSRRQFRGLRGSS